MKDSVLIKGDINSIDINIDIPASKSFTQRILACAYICKGVSLIEGVGKSNDEIALLEVIKNLGANIFANKPYLEVHSNGILDNLPITSNISFHESGLAARMMTPIIANLKNNLCLNGSGSLMNRPMNVYDDLMYKLEVSFKSSNGYLPFQLNGPLLPKSISVPGNFSSQYITGLILGYVASPYLKKQQITIENAVSIPYINMTLEVLKQFNINIEYSNDKIYFNGPYQLKPCITRVEGDWSSASFFLVAGAVMGSCRITNLSQDSIQADRKIIEAIEEFGSEVSFSNECVVVKQNKMESFRFDATHCPDVFPALAVLACFGNKASVIHGINRLVSKESNRVNTIKSELEKMGAEILLRDNEMKIIPKNVYFGSNVNSHNDHRIAMACSIMALKCKGNTIINNPLAVNKSFPEFYNILSKCLS